MSTNGSFVYTPPAGFTGTDYFMYRARGETPTGLQLALGPETGHYAKVTIQVVEPPAPDVPAGSPDTFDVVEDTPLTVTSADFLANDSNASYVSYVSGALFEGQTPVRTQHGTLDISWTPFISDFSVRGAFQLTHGRRTKVLGDLTFEPMAASTCCWRAARSRSSSAGAQLFFRTRA